MSPNKSGRIVIQQRGERVTFRANLASGKIIELYLTVDEVQDIQEQLAECLRRTSPPSLSQQESTLDER